MPVLSPSTRAVEALQGQARCFTLREVPAQHPPQLTTFLGHLWDHALSSTTNSVTLEAASKHLPDSASSPVNQARMACKVGKRRSEITPKPKTTQVPDREDTLNM